MFGACKHFFLWPFLVSQTCVPQQCHTLYMASKTINSLWENLVLLLNNFTIFKYSLCIDTRSAVMNEWIRTSASKAASWPSPEQLFDFWATLGECPTPLLWALVKCSLTPRGFSPLRWNSWVTVLRSPQSGTPWRPTCLLLLTLIAHTKLTEVNGGLCSAQNSHALAIQRSCKTMLNPFIA